MARWMWASLIAVGAVFHTTLLCAQSAPPAVVSGRPGNLSEKLRRVGQNETKTGAIAGSVVDRHGRARAGVPVVIMRQGGGFLQRVFTQADGRFRLGNLLPGLYAAEIAEPDSLPVWKNAINVEPGAEFRLDISLLSLADSMEIRIPDSLKTASDDWKWTLRTAYPARPILRFQPEPPAPTGGSSELADARERALRGTVQFLAGNESDGFGQDPGLRTAFDMAYALQHSQQLALAGFAGWERSTPAASMHAAWKRTSAEGGTSTLSMTVRQLFLPSEYWSGMRDISVPSDRRIQSITAAYEEERVLSERLRLHAGSLYDTLTFGHRMARWSPFARLRFAPSETSQLTISYTGANPRVMPAAEDRRSGVDDQVLAIPQIASDGAARPMLEGGRHFEAQWEQQVGPEIRVQAAAFYDSLSHTAIAMAFAEPDGFAGGLLRDPFSDRYFLSAGNSHSPGARVAVAASLAPNTELIVGYSYAGTLEAPDSSLTAENPASLRDAFETHGEHAWTIKLNSRIPLTQTQFTTSYRWLAGNAVAVSDPYDYGLGRSRPFLNLLVLQPIPSPEIIPGHFEAMADFSNLLAQGYLAIRSTNGTVGTLFPAPRAFRGGFNFVF